MTTPFRNQQSLRWVATAILAVLTYLTSPIAPPVGKYPLEFDPWIFGACAALFVILLVHTVFRTIKEPGQPSTGD